MHRKRLKEFKRELKLLLDKHDAKIDYTMKGDTYGIYDDWLGVQFRQPLQDGDRFCKWSELYPLGED